MARRKAKDGIELQGLTDQQILLAYCSTMGEATARRAYKLLREEFEIDRTKRVRLNGFGVIDDGGMIRMTSNQHKKMIQECGEYKYKWLIGLLHSYMDSLKEKADLGDSRAKRQLKIYTSTSAYPRLMKGWVMERYNQEATPPPEDSNAGRIDFYKITNSKDAIAYINSIPLEILTDSPELDFLTNKFPEVNEYMRALQSEQE